MREKSNIQIGDVVNVELHGVLCRQGTVTLVTDDGFARVSIQTGRSTKDVPCKVKDLILLRRGSGR